MRGPKVCLGLLLILAALHWTTISCEECGPEEHHNLATDQCIGCEELCTSTKTSRLKICEDEKNCEGVRERLAKTTPSPVDVAVNTTPADTLIILEGTTAETTTAAMTSTGATRSNVTVNASWSSQSTWLSVFCVCAVLTALGICVLCVTRDRKRYDLVDVKVNLSGVQPINKTTGDLYIG